MYITAGNIMLDTAVSFLAMWVYLSYVTAAYKGLHYFIGCRVEVNMTVIFYCCRYPIHFLYSIFLAARTFSVMKTMHLETLIDSKTLLKVNLIMHIGILNY